MQIERWQKIERVFNDTLNLPVHQREKFVRSNCGGDIDLYREISRLLSESDKSGDFLSESVFYLGAQLLDEEFEFLLNASDFGHYKLKKFLGRGGIGAVFTAEDKRLKREVALKILPAVLEETDQRVVRFQKEAQMASAISHHNIAHIYEFGSYKGYYFLAMEYIKGETLRNLLKRGRPPLAATLKLIPQILKALIAAHKLGIIHRDIKPENIMISNEKRVKVLDFGLARQNIPPRELLDSENTGETNLNTHPGLLIGTAAYMSPEQIRGEALDERTDIWSLGVIFYEMLTGIHPFHKETNIETLHKILKEEPEKFEQARGNLPPSLFEIVDKCLAKERDRRFGKAVDVLRAINSVPVSEVSTGKTNHLKLKLIKTLRYLTQWVDGSR